MSPSSRSAHALTTPAPRSGGSTSSLALAHMLSRRTPGARVDVYEGVAHCAERRLQPAVEAVGGKFDSALRAPSEDMCARLRDVF
ncbi:hypothetical protein K488DRAFT_89072 [Vararia minispora EC-137]|uniref:Uncharacterized protein n=1 Tax=Vararia minispora EC-137 TaxID=1314806 RepID=A0ACB8QBJ7_9AGAM|nr:hypothetical protein K488DRAFT_89072 [Vararia minispora EC-137]